MMVLPRSGGERIADGAEKGLGKARQAMRMTRAMSS